MSKINGFATPIMFLAQCDLAFGLSSKIAIELHTVKMIHDVRAKFDANWPIDGGMLNWYIGHSTGKLAVSMA